MLTFYKQMFYGLLQFTYMTGATVSNFSLEKFVASSTGCDGSFKLKHRKLYVFLCASDGRTYNAAIVNLWSQSLQDETSDAGFWKDLHT